ncbi:MAG: PEP/pyruvate-binding domain-containing protein [Bryobacteraceae bacterium]|nr:PEP/pyruvate-binding domain-containing protein [Bryobacteraceae bacterium]
MRLSICALLAVAGTVPVFADSLLPPLTAQQSARAARLIQSFKQSPRGPFLRIRWFCKDGTVHPPAGTPCRERGGGNQHAELSPGAKELARYNIDVGTILVSQNFDQLFDARRDHHVLRQMVLQKYLIDIDDGWIYRQAMSYRGARQAEDEDKAGRLFLVRLLSNPQWTRLHYLLANEIVSVLPHGLPDSKVKRVRVLATSIAERDARFQPIRARIHSNPSDRDLELVEEFLAEKAPAAEPKRLIEELARLLKEEKSGRNLSSGLSRLPVAKRPALEAAVREFETALGEASSRERFFAAGAALTVEIHRAVTTSRDGEENLRLLDFNALLQEAAFAARIDLKGASRRQLLGHVRDHFRYALGAGLLSPRQYDALDGEIRTLESRREVSPGEWFQAVKYLTRSAEWTRAAVARDFGPVSRLYTPIEPAARALVDHLVRGSMALPLSHQVETLMADAHRAVGIRHAILGQGGGGGVVGLNPGIAVGRLGILATNQEAAGAVDPRGIYVIPETVSDLKPMAGILTLDSGNMLSHTQLLAANLGIPNATVPSSLLPMFEKLKSAELFYAVTPKGVVVVREKASLTPEERKLFVEKAPVRARFALDASRVNLQQREILRLADMGSRDSGILAGPKAANLGQLASYFPNEVAPGLVVPFGIYWDHINRTLPGDSEPLSRQIAAAYGEADRMRDAGASPTEISGFIYPRLDHFRKQIRSMPLLPAFQNALVDRMRKMFGEDGTYGVFVRSDTNAEDLPEFTGAGLNLTVPNQVGTMNILQAIREVWASPFAERAYEWRSRIMSGSDRVYPSVIVQRAVPSDKSGVIATVNLETGDRNESTVNVSEGVSAVVDGGVAESLLLLPDGSTRLLQQARGTYRKRLKSEGGFENVPVSGEERVLTDAEIARVRRLIAEVKAKYPPVRMDGGEAMPWDIEFGFEGGRLRLFQIRPLVRYQEVRLLEAFSKLEGPAAVSGPVRLDEGLAD